MQDQKSLNKKSVDLSYSQNNANSPALEGHEPKQRVKESDAGQKKLEADEEYSKLLKAYVIRSKQRTAQVKEFDEEQELADLQAQLKK